MFLKRSWILTGSMDEMSKLCMVRRTEEKARKHKANNPTTTTREPIEV